MVGLVVHVHEDSARLCWCPTYSLEGRRGHGLPELLYAHGGGPERWPHFGHYLGRLESRQVDL